MKNKFYIEEEYKRIAKKYNLTEKQVKEIYESQFEVIRIAMKDNDRNDPDSYKNINMLKLGKLYAKKHIIERCIRFAKLKEEKNE